MVKSMKWLLLFFMVFAGLAFCFAPTDFYKGKYEVVEIMDFDESDVKIKDMDTAEFFSQILLYMIVKMSPEDADRIFPIPIEFTENKMIVNLSDTIRCTYEVESDTLVRIYPEGEKTYYSLVFSDDVCLIKGDYLSVRLKRKD